MAGQTTGPRSANCSGEALQWIPQSQCAFQEIAVSFVRLIAALLLAVLLSGCQTGPPVVRTPDGFDPPYNYY